MPTDTERIDELEKGIQEHAKCLDTDASRLIEHGKVLTNHAERLTNLEKDVAVVTEAETHAPHAVWVRFKAAAGKVLGPILAVVWPVVKYVAPYVGVVFLTMALTGTLALPGCPGPGPVPPTPHVCPTGQHWDDTQQKCVPDTPPVPPRPIPKDGFRVVIQYDKTKLTPDQEDGIVYGRDVRDYLESHCVLDAEAGNKAYWIIPTGADVSSAPKWVQDVVAKNPGPGIVVSDGKAGYVGPIPATKAEALTILKKFGG